MSSRIYELFGYLTADRTNEATRHRKECACPFSGQECDGGGNRYQSFLNLDTNRDRALVAFFNGRKDNIPAGVCSLRTSERVWIVCPRRQRRGKAAAHPSPTLPVRLSELFTPRTRFPLVSLSIPR